MQGALKKFIAMDAIADGEAVYQCNACRERTKAHRCMFIKVDVSDFVSLIIAGPATHSGVALEAVPVLECGTPGQANANCCISAASGSAALCFR